MKKILIVGCGELGSRFLQAAMTLTDISEIDIVEPSEKARETAFKRMQDTGRDMNTIEVNWYLSLGEVRSAGDMAVVATQADVRLTVFEAVVKIGYRYFLIEKIVTQSDADYIKMMDISRLHNAQVWVNCKTRNYPIWKYIHSKIDPEEKLIFHSTGGNHGLCTNGLHSIDLFVFLSRAEKMNILDTRFDQELQHTKRGKYDLSGQLQIENPGNKSSMILTYDNNHEQAPVDVLITKKFRWIIDNVSRQAFESTDTQKDLRPIPFEGDVTVSGMSRIFIDDILKNNNCELPTLNECYLAHKVMFEATLPLFNTLLVKADDVCPVT